MGRVIAEMTAAAMNEDGITVRCGVCGKVVDVSLADLSDASTVNCERCPSLSPRVAVARLKREATYSETVQGSDGLAPAETVPASPWQPKDLKKPVTKTSTGHEPHSK